uniref:ATP synthase complex subunit 8 n=1 Tax=Tropiocolotes steudneri TaxID=401551 RepID=A0A0A1HAL8_9SAUR|nr:ATPase subunit 8 [Tropiocolotes steudneri]
MPQLNPLPWFSIMVTTWLTLTLLLMPMLHSLHPHTNATQDYTTPTQDYWTWPWQ